MKLSEFLPFCYAVTNEPSVELYHRYWLMLNERWGETELEDVTPGAPCDESQESRCSDQTRLYCPGRSDRPSQAADLEVVNLSHGYRHFLHGKVGRAA